MAKNEDPGSKTKTSNESKKSELKAGSEKLTASKVAQSSHASQKATPTVSKAEVKITPMESQANSKVSTTFVVPVSATDTQTPQASPIPTTLPPELTTDSAKLEVLVPVMTEADSEPPALSSSASIAKAVIAPFIRLLEVARDEGSQETPDSKREEDWSASSLDESDSEYEIAMTETLSTGSSEEGTEVSQASGFGRAEDYSWIEGKLIRVHSRGGSWQIRYAPFDELDRYGGQLVLIGPLGDEVGEGDFIHVEGRTIGFDPRHLGTTYRIQSIRQTKKSNGPFVN